MHITVSTPVVESPRVLQIRGMFDLACEKTSRLEWDAELPLHARPWNLGLIVGPSGCGKSTLARHLFADALRRQRGLNDWPGDRSLLDAFPEEMSVRDVAELLSAVGFASPPAWLRPFHVLSTGQQFRVGLARLLASARSGRPAVVDEFTSTVDRTVAQVGSAALARTVRRRNLQVVAVTCHEDVEAWLQPDWAYRPAENRFVWRCLQRRPRVVLDVVRCKASAWPLFAPHHYLSHGLMPGAVCFLASCCGRPVAFSAWAPFYGKGPATRREHRTVTLPDYQGLGIGNLLSATVAGMWKGLNCRAVSTTTHPAMIRARQRSPLWRMTRRPSLAGRGDVMRHATTRLTAGFLYVGLALAKDVARTLLGS
jgi:ABC-type transport system involved in cytochrome c biogenesis ATPase subunit